MKIILPLTAHCNGVVYSEESGLISGSIGDYVRIAADGSFADSGVHLCDQIVSLKTLMNMLHC